MFLPNEGAGSWPLISMPAILGGTMRASFTGIVFAFALTHHPNVLLPLLIASITAHGFTVLVLRRSILTEKISRRGFHSSREYAIDPLEILFTRKVVRTNLVALSASSSIEQVRHALKSSHGPRGQHLYPVVDHNHRLHGVMTRKHLRKQLDATGRGENSRTLGEYARLNPIVAHPDEPLRLLVNRMAEHGLTRFPVVERGESGRLAGIVSLRDLLGARTRNLTEERERERVLRIRLPFGGNRDEAA